MLQIWATLWMSRSGTSLTTNVDILGCKVRSICRRMTWSWWGFVDSCKLGHDGVLLLPVLTGDAVTELPPLLLLRCIVFAIPPHGISTRAAPTPNLFHPEYPVTPYASAKFLAGLVLHLGAMRGFFSFLSQVNKRR
ncbi:hypothetical protein J6590_013016 [Homalodisca vitripennis]|nr:hypothetical protein J6590_013016 [Homalodisca vitripennis]